MGVNNLVSQSLQCVSCRSVAAQGGDSVSLVLSSFLLSSSFKFCVNERSEREKKKTRERKRGVCEVPLNKDKRIPRKYDCLSSSNVLIVTFPPTHLEKFNVGRKTRRKRKEETISGFTYLERDYTTKLIPGFA